MNQWTLSIVEKLRNLWNSETPSSELAAMFGLASARTALDALRTQRRETPVAPDGERK